MATDAWSSSDWILLPGTLCTGAVFDGFLDTLDVPDARRKPIKLDHPEIDDYTRVFEGLNKNTIVCGFSLGAIVAAHHSALMKARALVLFGMNPYPDDPAKAEGRHALANDVKARSGAEALQGRSLVFNGDRADMARALVYEMAENAAWEIDAQTHLALSRPGALQMLADCPTPVLTITGSLDRDAPPAHGKAAAMAAPTGHHETLDGVGHFALLEDPVACAAAVAQFLDGRHDRTNS